MPPDLLLPLFPLEVVLFPGTRLPLHIFEERYKLMIGEAIRHNSEFGLVLSKEKGVLNVGCTAAVEKVVRRYPDGRLDIITVGRRRFEVLFLDEEKTYLRAGVVFFEDEPESTPAEDAVRHLVQLFEQALGFLSKKVTETPEPGKGLITFQIAGVLPLDLDLKQQLLIARSESERVTMLTEFLQKLLPRLKLAEKVERKSRGNGKGR